MKYKCTFSNESSKLNWFFGVTYDQKKSLKFKAFKSESK